MTGDYESAIHKALAYMKANLAQPLTVEMVSEQTGFSASWVGKIFKRHTGQGMLHHLLQLRMEKSKQLLRDTELSVTEIAFEVGFNSYTHFTNTFRSKQNITPSQFRRISRREQISTPDEENADESKAFSDRFEDPLTGTALGKWWRTSGTTWKQEGNGITARGDSQMFLRFLRPLPENFRVSFESCFLPAPGLQPSELLVGLGFDSDWQAYCSFAVGAHDNSTGELRLWRAAALQENQHALIRPGIWQTVILELKDDTVLLHLDGERVFSYRDPFPPSYALRNRISLGAWRSIVKFRNFAVEDLGFLPLVRTVRQGDLMFNAEFFDQARDFYRRLLRSNLSHTETMELHYKIGMCFLRLEYPAKAAAWFQKPAVLPETDFWSQQARLSLLAVTLPQKKMSELPEQVEPLLENPVTHDGARAVVLETCSRFSDRGFADHSATLLEALLHSEDLSRFRRFFVQQQLARVLLSLNRFSEAQEHLRVIVDGSSHLEQFCVHALIELVDALAFQGKRDEAKTALLRAEAMTKTESVLARCQSYKGLLLRGQGQFDQALKVLRDTKNRFPEAKDMGAFAELTASLIYCGMGNTKKSREAFLCATKIGPQSSFLRPGSVSRFLYPPAFVDGDTNKAAKALIEDFRTDSPAFARHAEQGIKAGILVALTGHKKKAKEIWSETSRRFPENRCRYYSSLAESLLKEETDRLEEMPFPARDRSEMFFLVGCLCNTQGKRARARELWELSVKEDPTNEWPAVQAKRRLEEVGNVRR